MLKFLPSRRKENQTWQLDPELGTQIVNELRSGQGLGDRRFDRLFSPQTRDFSSQHWTPLDVGRRAAELLSDGKGYRILDVGSGVGKFCLVGAITSPAHFFGVEQRGWLVQQANQLARRLDIPRVHFVNGNMRGLNWGHFDGFYFYNPFYEKLESASRIDDSFESGQESFHDSTLWVTARLAGLKIGSRVVTFHGFGGDLPASFEQQSHEAAGDDFLDLWIKQS